MTFKSSLKIVSVFFLFMMACAVAFWVTTWMDEQTEGDLGPMRTLRPAIFQKELPRDGSQSHVSSGPSILQGENQRDVTAEISILVVDQDGSAISFVQVLAQDPGDSGFIVELTTDEVGTCSLVTPASVKKVTLHVNGSRLSKPEFTQCHANMNVVGPFRETEFKVVLQRCMARVRFAAKTTRGEPIKRLPITVISDFGKREVGQTDDNGELEIANLPCGANLPGGKIYYICQPTERTSPRVLAQQITALPISNGGLTIANLQLREWGKITLKSSWVGAVPVDPVRIRVTFSPVDSIATSVSTILGAIEEKVIDAPPGLTKIHLQSNRAAFADSSTITVRAGETVRCAIRVYNTGYDIKGRIVDYEGSTPPIANVAIQIPDPLDPKFHTILWTRSNKMGEFEFLSVPAVEVAVRVEIFQMDDASRDKYSFFGTVSDSWERVWTNSSDVILRLNRGYTVSVDADPPLLEGESISIDPYRFRTDFSVPGPVENPIVFKSLRMGSYVLQRIGPEGEVRSSKRVDLEALGQGIYKIRVPLTRDSISKEKNE